MDEVFILTDYCNPSSFNWAVKLLMLMSRWSMLPSITTYYSEEVGSTLWLSSPRRCFNVYNSPIKEKFLLSINQISVHPTLVPLPLTTFLFWETTQLRMKALVFACWKILALWVPSLHHFHPPHIILPPSIWFWLCLINLWNHLILGLYLVLWNSMCSLTLCHLAQPRPHT